MLRAVCFYDFHGGSVGISWQQETSTRIRFEYWCCQWAQQHDNWTGELVCKINLATSKRSTLIYLYLQIRSILLKLHEDPCLIILFPKYPWCKISYTILKTSYTVWKIPHTVFKTPYIVLKITHFYKQFFCFVKVYYYG